MHTILSDSWFLRTAARLYNWIRGIGKDSFFMHMAGSILKFAGRSLNSSAFVQIISRKGYLSGAWESCLIKSILAGLLTLPEKICRRIYGKIEGHFRESIAYKALRMVVNNLHILTAAMLFVSLAAPFTWNNLYAAVALVILTFLLFLKPAITGEAGINTGIISFYLAVFALAVTAAQVFSTSPGDSLRFFIFYADGFMLLLLIGSIRTTAQLRSVIEIVLFGITVTGLLGIWAAMTGVPVNPSLTDTAANPDMPGRVYATIKNTNDYAESLIVLLPFYLAVVLYSGSWKKKLLFIALAVPSFVALMLTYARTSWIGFAFGILIFVFFAGRRFLLPVVLLGLLSIPLMPQSIVNRVATIVTGDSSIEYRFKILRTVLPVLKDYWLTGIGLGTDVFREVIAKYPLYTDGNIPPHSHNIVLHVWIESGIIGILSFLGWILHLFKTGIRNLREQTDKTLKYVTIASISSIAGAIAAGMAEYIWHEHRVMLLFWTVSGILISAILQGRKVEGVQA